MTTGQKILFLGLLLIAVVIYVNKCHNKQNPSISQNQKTLQPLMVNGVVVVPTAFEDYIFASGTLVANEEVEIRNEIPGRITAILFKEGTKVKKGDLLLTLYDSDLQAQLKKLLLQGKVAQRTEERQKDLLTVNGISIQDYELSLNQLLSINADIDLMQSNLSKTQIKSPFSGIIGLKNVSTGAYLSINTLITSIQEIEPIKLEFAIPERYRSLISNNSPIKFTVEPSETILEGKIYAFESKINLQTRSVLIRAICANNDFKLFPGSFAQVKIPLNKIENAVLIPTQAIIPELKSQKVYIVKNGKAEKVEVKTGTRNNSSIHVTSGITEGDTVLITGLMQMKQGMPVKVNLKSQENKLNN